MKTQFIAFFGVAVALIIHGCGDDVTPEALNTALGSANTFVASAFPNITPSSSRSVHSQTETPRDLFLLTAAKWSSTTTSELIDPPGGVNSDPSSEPEYNGATLPTKVNYRDFMTMALDDNFRRAGSDGGTIRPTVFGRFDSLVQILGYLATAGISMDASGPAVGSYNSELTVDGNTIRVIVEVTNTVVTTHYARRLDIIGFVDTNGNTTYDTGETKMVDVLMWVKGSATELNFMQAEKRDGDDDGNIDTYNLSRLRWNRTTGALQFEYIQDASDSINAGNMEIFRLMIESTNGKAWVYHFQGKADSTNDNNDFIQWVLFTPSNGATEGTFSIRQVRAGGDVWLGNICATFATGVGSAGEAIPDDSSPGSGGTCAGQVTDSINTKLGIMGFANSVRAHTTAHETMDDLGFPATSQPDFSVASARAAWLTAGDSVGVGFSDRTSFIADWDATP